MSDRTERDDTWTKQEGGWWTSSMGGVVHETRNGRRGWYLWPLDGLPRGPYRTMLSDQRAAADEAATPKGEKEAWLR